MSSICSPLILLAICATLTGCNKSQSSEGTPTVENTEVVPQPSRITDDGAVISEQKPWHQRFDAGDLIQSGREATDKYSADAIKVLGKLKLEEIKEQAAGLGISIRNGNFDDAQIIADKLGDSLDSGSIGACVNFFRIQSEKGTEAAREEIEKYLSSANLTPEQKKAFEDLRDHIASMDTEEWISTVTFITTLACDAKFGHGGGAIGILVGEALRIAFNVKRTDFDQNVSGEQDGAGQPATRSESKSESDEKPLPGAEDRSR